VQRLEPGSRARAGGGADPVAIVGIGLRFPGADSPPAFRRLLREGRCALGADGAFLDEVDASDWLALGIAPHELKHTDPQHRLLLEVAQEALDDAGLTPAAVRGSRTGVFCGLIWDDYLRLLCRDPGRLDGYAVLGNVGAFAANRISYRFDLRGPSVTLNAACASSLVAVHQACQALRDGDAELALAGAAELMLSPDTDVLLSKVGVLSPTGRCRPLHPLADGFVRGEGAAMLVLKPASRLAAGDRVYALIAGSAVNHNGRNEWIMAASESGLREVIAEAWARAGVDRAEISYVELHGAATHAGDRIETRALAAALGPRGSRRPCRVGSVKTNLGHLGAAAGIAGLVRVAVDLFHREWTPGCGDEVDPALDLEGAGLVPQRACEPWSGGLAGGLAGGVEAAAAPVYAGVTATSLSGSNAHLLLAGVPPAPAAAAAFAVPLVLLSAPTAAGLDRRRSDLAAWLARGDCGDPADLAAVAYTCAVRRHHAEHRLAVAAGSRDELCRGLDGTASRGGFAVQGTAGRTAPLLLLCGVDSGGTAGALARSCELFAECARGLARELGIDGDVLAAGALPAAAADRFFTLVHVRLWQALGLAPRAVLQDAAAAAGAAAAPASWVAAFAPLPLLTLGAAELPAPAAGEAPPVVLAIGEVAAGRALAALGEGVAVLGAGAEGDPAMRLARTLAELYVRGFDLGWPRLYPRGRTVSLPPYPWQRRRYLPEGLLLRGASPPAVPPAAAVPAAPGTAALGERLRALPPGRRSEPLRAALRGAIARELALPADHLLRDGDPLFALGLNSLGVTRIRAALEAELGIPLSAVLFVEHPTIARLAERLLGELAGRAAAPASPADRRGAAGEPIAILGMACRFPGGADTPEKLWALLAAGVEAVAEMPAERRRHLGSPAERTAAGAAASGLQRGGFLDQVDGFDAGFFHIAPREARQLDPQQRLFLEVSWEALENAGIDAHQLAGSRTGVFAGALASDYAHLGPGPDERVDAYYYSGVGASFIAGRLSYFLGLHGPSITLDAACSSGLAALHLACRSLRDGESELAVAGGVSLMLSPQIGLYLSRAGTLSPTGRCRAFDRRADGMVRGEGCGVIVLQRLGDALAAGRPVLAVIRATALNHGGAAGGLTVPSPAAQSALYRQALAEAGLAGSEVAYVEAHGTGTLLGDPVELHGLAPVYGNGRRRPLYVGSVKTNLGHTDAAAGIAGLTKCVLALQHGLLPASLHCEEPNPEFDWSAHQLEVVRQATPLPSDERFVAVSAFGLSGANAHAILERAPLPPPPPPPGALAERPAPGLLLLSARQPRALRQLAGAYVRALRRSGRPPDEGVADVCYTAARGRAHHACRLAVVGGTAAELAAALEARQRGRPAGEEEDVEPGHFPGGAGGTVFVFPGQGGQWPGMGRELADRHPVFAAVLAEIDAVFLPLAGRSILPGPEIDPARGDDTEIAQPALFAMQVGLAAVWRDLGFTPTAIIGHSLGEVAAAHAAGCLGLADAVRVVFHRSRLLQQATGRGKMLSVNLGFEAARELIAPWTAQVGVAVHNSPGSVVLSGEAEELEEIAGELDRRGIFHRPLRVRFASHCPQMARYQQPLRAALADLRAAAPRIPVYTCVTGGPAGAGAFDAEHWARNIRQPVRFADAVAAVLAQGARLLVEVGAHPVLQHSLHQCLEAAGVDALAIGSLRRGEPEWAALLAAVGSIYEAGLALDLPRLFPRGRIVRLPNYPWRRRRFWLAAAAPSAGDAAAPPPGGPAAEPPLLGRRVPSPLPQVQYRARIGAGQPPVLAGHELWGAALCPASAFIAAALAAAGAEELPAALRDVVFTAELPLGEPVDWQLVLEPGTREREFRIFSSRDGSSWTCHAAGVAGEPLAAEEAAAAAPPPPVGEARSADDFYAALAERGYRYEAGFRAVRRLVVGDGEVWAEIEAVAPSPDACSPPLLDACTQPVLALAGGTPLPVAVASCRLFAPLAGALTSHVRRCAGGADPGGRGAAFDIDVYAADGSRCAALRGFTLRGEAAGQAAGAGARRDWRQWCYEPAWQALPVTERSGGDTAARLLAFAGGDERAAALLAWLESRGCEVLRVEPGPAFAQLDERRWTVDPLRAEDVQLLCRQLWPRPDGPVPIVPIAPIDQVLYLGGLDEDGPGDLETVSPSELLRRQEAVYGGALALLQALAALPDPPPCWLLTAGAQAVGEEVPRPAQATLWGLARVAAQEVPGLRTICLDLDPAGPDPRDLWQELGAEDGESQLAYRRGVRHVLRLVPRGFPAAAPFRVGLAAFGQLEHLRRIAIDPGAPGPGEVLIRTEAVPLNFRDVLNALGMLPDLAAELGVRGPAEMTFGFECLGTVAAVGEGVASPRAGDRVIAAPLSGALASHVVAPADRTVAVPPGIEPLAAACLPIAFMTAWHGLQTLARLGAGDRVLIHAAAGGVGLAAVQLARLAGAEVFATAHPQKWETLRRLDVRWLASSRDPECGAEILRLSGGRGVTVVLNSLSGPFIAASLRACAPGARFVEIGQRGAWSAEQVAASRPDVAYFQLVFSRVADREPGLAGELLRKLMGLLASGAVQPLPVRRFAADDLVGAFRHLALARHVGKVAITMPAAPRLPVCGDASYLITGGLGALGLEVAAWLVERGARHLVLTGRSEPKPAAEAALAARQSSASPAPRCRSCAASCTPPVRSPTPRWRARASRAFAASRAPRSPAP
jgi:acyl transferase domain-containing protein/NADPH:quinone reductase-like Zn-dependent oxidoreductase